MINIIIYYIHTTISLHLTVDIATKPISTKLLVTMKGDGNTLNERRIMYGFRKMRVLRLKRVNRKGLGCTFE